MSSSASYYKEIIDYICTGTGLCLECSGDFAPGFLIVQIVLLLIGSGLSIFDTITDWNIVIQFRDHGFQNPLLPIDINWLRAWYLFTVIGTILTAITVFHETLDVLHFMWHTCKRCCCKSGKRYRVLKEKEEGNVVEMANKTEDSNTTQGKQTTESQEDWSEGTDTDHHDHQYHLYQDGSNENLITGDQDENKKDANDRNDHTEKGTGTTAQTESKDANSEDDDETIDDACKCCYRYGWNFTTRAETLSFLSLWFHDTPVLTMAVLYAFAQSTCKLPEREDITGELLNVGISATASTIAASYRLTRSFIRLFISVGVRIKSKKEASKMGKWGKRCSRLLPEVGDAVFPKNTCAEWCIIPYYGSLIFDIILVSMGASIAFSIWANYRVLKQNTNFDDSLGIYRFQLVTDGSYTFVTNISGTIIPSSGSSSNNPYVVLETIQDRRGYTKYCLSEFQYVEKDSEIIFDTVELQPISNNGDFCAVKSGYNSQDSGNFSSCTYYYGSPGLKVLRYAFSDPTTGRTKLLENECTVLKDRLPPVKAGPRFDTDLRIQVEKNINRTFHPDATHDLRILFVGIQNSTARVLTYVSVADIVAGDLDVTYLHTFQDPADGTNITYLFRFYYDNYIKQFTYNVREVYNYPPPRNGACTCSSTLIGLNTLRQFLKMGVFVYGYYDLQTGFYRFLRNCSVIPSDKLFPRYDYLLSVPCSSLCG